MLRHRLVLLAAVGLAAALVAAPARAGQESHKYVPDDAEMITTLNFRQILESQLAKTHKDKVDQAKGLLEFAVQNNVEAKRYLEALGFDLFRDFNSITVAAAASANPEKALIVIEGKFNAEKFAKTAEEAAKEHGDILKVNKVGNYKVWEVNPPGQDKTLYVSLVNGSTLLATLGKQLMTDALTRAAQVNGPAFKKEVKELLKTTSPTQSFNLVATGKALAVLAEQAAKNNPQAQMAGPILKKMAGVSAAITVGKDIDFQVGIGTESKEAADMLSGQAAGILAFGKGMVAQKAKEDPKMEAALDIMKTMQTSVEGTTVLIRGQVAAAVLEKAIKNAGQ
jgi:hypothetical protein